MPGYRAIRPTLLCPFYRTYRSPYHSTSHCSTSQILTVIYSTLQSSTSLYSSLLNSTEFYITLQQLHTVYTVVIALLNYTKHPLKFSSWGWGQCQLSLMCLYFFHFLNISLNIKIYGEQNRLSTFHITPITSEMRPQVNNPEVSTALNQTAYVLLIKLPQFRVHMGAVVN